jgi:uncharacterized iron-regulated membrane protein
MRIKKLIGKIHLILGLASSLVVFIVAITGAIWAFESEISDLAQPYRRVEARKQAYISASKLKELARPYFKNQHIDGIEFSGANRAAVIRAWKKQGDHYTPMSAYFNPYDGTFLHFSQGRGFFEVVIDLHINLLLGDVGREIVDYSTLVFVVMLISGIVLWWPKNRAASKQRFRFNWKNSTKWRRKNYDLHNVLGFYAAWIAIFIALTGLAWGFDWVNKAIYYSFSAGADYVEWLEVRSKSPKEMAVLPNIEDRVFEQASQAYGKPFASLSIYFPNDGKSAISCNVNPSAKTYYRSATYHYDARDGKPLGQEKFEDMNAGQKVRSMYYDIHIGKILGFPGQVLVFLASLIVASLPISGTIIYFGRKRKQASKENSGKESREMKPELI